MNVLKHLAHVMWDHIGDLHDDEDAQRIAEYADKSGSIWNLVKEDAGMGTCDITGQIGMLSTVEEMQ